MKTQIINRKVSKDLMLLLESRYVRNRSYSQSRLFLCEINLMKKVYFLKHYSILIRRRIQAWFYRSTSVIAHVLPFLFKTRYYMFWRRDCDMFESTSFYEFPSKYHAEYFKDKQAEWAEGPEFLQEISKQEYLESQTSYRDRVMEAYENGNGKSVIV